MPESSVRSAPLSDALITSVSRLVDDAQALSGPRQPTHSQIQDQFVRAGLQGADPNLNNPKPIGKSKRLRAVLQWAFENDLVAGERLVLHILALVRGVGGFRSSSANYVGEEVIRDLKDNFISEGFVLTESGELVPAVLEGLSGTAMTVALEKYVARARRGSLDAALVAGTGKDLLEAVAAHVLTSRFGDYSHSANFPTLLGQAYIAAGLSVQKIKGQTALQEMDVALFEVACAINKLRNKEGTGHGRPFLSTLKTAEARLAVQCMGIVSERLLEAIK